MYCCCRRRSVAAVFLTTLLWPVGSSGSCDAVCAVVVWLLGADENGRLSTRVRCVNFLSGGDRSDVTYRYVTSCPHFNPTVK